MRCVNPAGFPSKWLYLISMHGLGKGRPEAPLFNYIMILGGACGGGCRGVMTASREQQGGRQVQQVSQNNAPLVISSCNDAQRETGKKEVINAARTHTHLCTCVHT